MGSSGQRATRVRQASDHDLVREARRTSVRQPGARLPKSTSRRPVSDPPAPAVRAGVGDVALAVDVGLEVDHLGGRLGRADGAARPRRWPAATSAAESVRRTPILAATSSSSGPRCSVFMWMTRSTPAVGLQRRRGSAARPGVGRLAEQQALGLDREDDRHHDQQHADHARCRRRRSTRFSVIRDERHAPRRRRPGPAARPGPRAGSPAARAPWRAG